MFRQSVSEFSLTGARSALSPKPSYKPAVEALEERVVLSGGFGFDFGISDAVSSAVGQLGQSSASHHPRSSSGSKGMRDLLKAQKVLRNTLQRQTEEMVFYAQRAANKEFGPGLLNDPDVTRLQAAFQGFKNTLVIEKGLRKLVRREVIQYPALKGSAIKFKKQSELFNRARHLANLGDYVTESLIAELANPMNYF